ncbi:hypothetical protein GCM10010269_23230 [Streptomyces humidus]|uniref:Uncharacterized protein n=1 Tax=Streptomyces humidus TaxID=52259 RepID=A0A918L2F9_9ACTN|nr:hypothetical protein [Streptomyces humidus]GGR83437.1 hypothetical protein GCM10010269_23230 [Streptomyces humidus]
MGMKMTMTTRCTVAVRWQHLRVVIIVVVIAILSLPTHGPGDSSLLDTLLPRV